MAIAQLLLAPVFLHVALTVWVGVRTISGRVASVRSRETRLKAIALDSGGWPDRVKKLGNNFDNQFQLPMMWYGAVAMLLATGFADWVAVVLSWAFVASRLVHSLIHTGANNVVRRMFAFLSGFGIVLLMWAWFALRLYWIG